MFKNLRKELRQAVIHLPCQSPGTSGCCHGIQDGFIDSFRGCLEGHVNQILLMQVLVMISGLSFPCRRPAVVNPIMTSPLPCPV